ncbi:DNA cytosine methyltransferase [Clostridium perfringens]|uniref:DNA cytosine methyltransferase n=1 Tax=Clostridium perfringens TaxID=1502 RepID=UPI003995CF89|nr:DNA cytosine methyltransferase [Clostridium perfringens]
MKKISVVSLFSGCGGLDIGFEQNGFETIFATDVWDTACNTLIKNNIAKKVKCEDIRKIDFRLILKEHNKIDCIIGGPPCPPYSQTRHYLTNKKSGLEDEKAGFAVPEYFRAVEELEPKIFVFENVDGFTFKTHKDAFDFVKEKANDLGYKIFFKVVNCANYGIPQTRKRFFCVGVKKNLPDFEFPEETHADPSKDENKKAWVTCGDVISEYDYITEEEKKQRPGSKDYELFKNIPPGDNYLYYTEKRGYPDPKFKWKSRYWTFLLKLSPNRPSWTIQASFSNNQGPFHWKNRFLRIEEIKRIQTFPDDYNLVGDFKEQWRQVGNAVPPMMASIIAKKIREVYFSE